MSSSSSPQDDPTPPPSHLTVSEDLVPSQPPQKSQIITLDFNGLLNPPLKLQTDVSECGGQIWPAGMVLAEYLMRNKTEELMGKTMFTLRANSRFFHGARVELGAGSGLVGLALAIHLTHTTSLSSTIHLTDGSPALLPLLQHNISLNAPSLSPRSLLLPSLLPWGVTNPLPPSIPKEPDILLAADCAYFEPAFPKLLDTMRALIGEETVCWFCVKKRRKGDKGMVRLVERERGWVVGKVGGKWEAEGVGLWWIRRREERVEAEKIK